MTTEDDNNELHRLESYQSGPIHIGGSGNDHVGGTAVVPRDINNNDGNVNSTNVVGRDRRPPPASARLVMQTQFSLVGSSDDYDSIEKQHYLEDESNFYFIVASLKRCWRHILFVFVERKILVLVIVSSFVLSLPVIMAVKSKHGQTSTPASSVNNMTCPIQSSYSVSADIMELKKSSTGEFSISFYDAFML